MTSESVQGHVTYEFEFKFVTETVAVQCTGTILIWHILVKIRFSYGRRAQRQKAEAKAREVRFFGESHVRAEEFCRNFDDISHTSAYNLVCIVVFDRVGNNL